MQVIDDGVPVDALISVIKGSVAQAGVPEVPGSGNLRVASVQLTLRVMATRTFGGGLDLRVPVIGAEIRLGARVTTQDTHTIDIELVPQDRPAARTAGTEEIADVLVAAITTVRETMASAAGGDDPWVLSESSVDLSFVITKSGTISIGAEGELAGEVTHSLQLSLAPSGVES